MEFPTVRIAVPARLESSRLSKKLLRKLPDGNTILGTTLCACTSQGISEIFLAADDISLLDIGKAQCIPSFLTPIDIPNGSSRSLFCFSEQRQFIDPNYSATHVCVVAGDEPMIDHQAIRTVIQFALDNPRAQAVLAYCDLPHGSDPNDTSIGKMVVREQTDEVLYVSRAAIPCGKADNVSNTSYKIHVGIYVYRTDSIDTILQSQLQQPLSRLQTIEDREEIGLLELGIVTMACKVDPQAPGVNTISDLDYLWKQMSKTIIFKEPNVYPDIVTLDCTLRDGGYLNDWSCTDNEAATIFTAVSDANFHFAEIGYCRHNDETHAHGKWRQLTQQDAANLSSVVPRAARIAVMVNITEIDETLFDGTDGSQSAIKLIRIFTAKVDQFPKAARCAQCWIKAGYLVTVNIGYANRVTDDDEILNGIQEHLVGIGLFALYFADSQSALTPAASKRLFQVLSRRFPSERLAFHCHNAKQDAFHKTQKAIRGGASMIDSCVAGAGRGPGNFASELLAIQQEDMGISYLSAPPVLRCAHWMLSKGLMVCTYSPVHAFNAVVGCHPDYGCNLISDTDSHQTFMGVLNGIGGAQTSFDKSLVPPRRKDAIVFDLDGTLVDSIAGIVRSVCASNEFDPLSVEALLRKGKRVGEIFDQLSTNADSKDQFMKDFSDNDIRGPTPNAFHDSLQTLKALKEKGIVVCVATSRPYSHAIEILEKASLLPYIDDIQGTEFSEPSKPNPLCIEKTLARVHANALCMVGDSAADMVAAARLCIPSILISKEVINGCHPTFVCKSLLDVIVCLNLT